jgi:hypothetical protein
MIMFVGKVAQWRWGQKRPDEWSKYALSSQLEDFIFDH